MSHPQRTNAVATNYIKLLHRPTLMSDCALPYAVQSNSTMIQNYHVGMFHLYFHFNYHFV